MSDDETADLLHAAYNHGGMQGLKYMSEQTKALSDIWETAQKDGYYTALAAIEAWANADEEGLDIYSKDKLLAEIKRLRE